MKCKEFKRLVVDLFDREVDSNIRMECERHMASCASCREYYDELNEAVGFLTPRKEVVKSRERKAGNGVAQDMEGGGSCANIRFWSGCRMDSLVLV